MVNVQIEPARARGDEEESGGNLLIDQGKNLRINTITVTSGFPNRRAPDLKCTRDLTGFKDEVGLKLGILCTNDCYLLNDFQNEGVLTA